MSYKALFFIVFCLSVCTSGCDINFSKGSSKQKSEQDENEKETDPRNIRVAKAIKDNTIAHMLINEKDFFDEAQQHSSYPTGNKGIKSTYFYLAAKYLDEQQIKDFFGHYNTILPVKSTGAQSLAYMGISNESLETIYNVHGLSAEKLKEIFFIPKYNFAELLDNINEQRNIIETFKLSTSSTKDKEFDEFRKGIVAEAIKQGKLKDFLIKARKKPILVNFYLSPFNGELYTGYPTGDPKKPFGKLQDIIMRYLNEAERNELVQAGVFEP